MARDRFQGIFVPEFINRKTFRRKLDLNGFNAIFPIQKSAEILERREKEILKFIRVCVYILKVSFPSNLTYVRRVPLHCTRVLCDQTFFFVRNVTRGLFTVEL